MVLVYWIFQRATASKVAVSAQNPPAGFSFVIRVPIVLTIRQPPESVPSAIRRVRKEQRMLESPEDCCRGYSPLPRPHPQ